MLAAYLDGPYQLILVLHILAAIVGFGAVFLNAIYGARVAEHQRRAHPLPHGLDAMTSS